MENQINYFYLISWVITITIGMFQFGYSLASYNTLTSFMFYHYKHNNHEGFYMEDMNMFNSIVTAVVPVGGIFGVLWGSKLASCGRRLSLIYISLIWAIGSLVTLFRNFYLLNIGRFVVGFSSGSYSVIVPLFVSEIAPVSISGSLGALNQLMLHKHLIFY